MGVTRRSVAIGLLSLLVSSTFAHAQIRPEKTPKPKEPPPSKPESKPALRKTRPAVVAPKLADLAIQTSANAEVYLDDEFRGRAGPEGRLWIREVVPGPHKLRVMLSGKQPFEATVSLREGSANTISADLSDLLGELVIQTSPGAEIFVDGMNRGQAGESGNRTLQGIAPGSHEVRISAERKQDWKRTVLVTAGEAVAVSAPLADLPGKLAISTTPGAEILIDGLGRGEVGQSGELILQDIRPGTHEVCISAERKQTWKGSVVVGAGETYVVNAPLADMFGALEIRTMPGADVAIDQHSGGKTDSEGKLEVRDLEPGAHHVEIFRVGYESWEQSVTINAGGSLRLDAKLDLASSEFLLAQTLTGHGDAVTDVAFGPDGRNFASSSDDRTVKLWELPSGAEVRTLRGHEGSVRSVAFSPDGRYLASGSDDKMVKIWEAATGAEVRTLKGHREGVVAVTFSPDGRYVSSGSLDELVKLWDAATGEEIRTIKGNGEAVFALSFSPDGHSLAWASDASTIRLLSVATGQEAEPFSRRARWLRRLPIIPIPSPVPVPNLGITPLPAIPCIAFSPDGRYLTSGSHDKKIRIWDVAKRRQTRTLEGHKDTITSLAFNPDGRYLASASRDKTIGIWELSTGRELHKLVGHTKDVYSVAFSPDGRFLASASADKTVKLWRRKGRRTPRQVAVPSQ